MALAVTISVNNPAVHRYGFDGVATAEAADGEIDYTDDLVWKIGDDVVGTGGTLDLSTLPYSTDAAVTTINVSVEVDQDSDDDDYEVLIARPWFTVSKDPGATSLAAGYPGTVDDPLDNVVGAPAQYTGLTVAPEALDVIVGQAGWTDDIAVGDMVRWDIDGAKELRMAIGKTATNLTVDQDCTAGAAKKLNHGGALPSIMDAFACMSGNDVILVGPGTHKFGNFWVKLSAPFVFAVEGASGPYSPRVPTIAQVLFPKTFVTEQNPHYVLSRVSDGVKSAIRTRGAGERVVGGLTFARVAAGWCEVETYRPG